ncbi:hypothetical protein IPM62_01195 [Candidatus Woesebacteria bacterium]|nr:MAG: hypothetical protein IPM62_01195 [Candidatus Woesebacteria bacterium]
MRRNFRLGSEVSSPNFVPRNNPLPTGLMWVRVGEDEYPTWEVQVNTGEGRLIPPNTHASHAQSAVERRGG